MPAYLHKVTCKIALYNPDKTEVLLVEYGQNDFGLPGGHLEQFETPQEAMMRELSEELGVTRVDNLVSAEFWQHPNGKIILGFTATLSELTEVVIDTRELRSARKTKVADIESGAISAGTYDGFIIKHATLD